MHATNGNLLGTPSQPEDAHSLLEHYTDVSMHHRTIMLGFGGIYFAVTQYLAFSQPEKTTLVGNVGLPAIASGALLLLLVLAAVLHHASAFCKTAAMKATYLMHIHYRLLPVEEEEIDFVHETVNAFSRKSKAFSGGGMLRSVHIVCILFTLLFVSNTYLFWTTAQHVFDSGGPLLWVSLGASVLGILMFIFYYAVLFRRHLALLAYASRNLEIVLDCPSRELVAKRLEQY